MSSSPGQEDGETSSSVNASAKKRKKSVKGWDGENGFNSESGNGNHQGFVDGELFRAKRAVFLIRYRSSIF